MATHDHPVFSRIYAVLAGLEEGGTVGAARTRAAADLAGRTLIVGLGPGFDLGHLPAAVTEVVAIEPSGPMRAAARGRIADFDRPVELIDAVAESLPLPDDSVDSILFAYVLCSVTDQSAALSEAFRVLRPGGCVALLEHVRGADGTWSRRSQRLVAPVWPHVAGGCRCDRDTRAALESAGFDTSTVTDEKLVNIPPVAPIIIGTARPRS